MGIDDAIMNGILILILTMLHAILSAQSSHTGMVEEQYMGITFTVPEGWTAYKTAGGFLIGSDSQKGLILIMQNEYSSMESIRAGAMEGIIDEENGIILQPETYPEHFSENGIQIRLAGQVEWQHVKAYAIGLLTPFSSGLTILTAVDPTIFSEEYVERVQNIAKKITFSKPTPHPIAEQWKFNLTGMRLTYMNTYSSGSSGGYSDKIVIDLCSGQVFKYSDRSSMSLDVSGGFAYSHGQNQGDGTWDIISAGDQPVLQLSFYDNTTRRYAISMQGDKFFLDNRQYFRTRDAACGN